MHIVFYSYISNAQNRGNIWCFGDSAGIDFNNGAVPINSSLNTRGSCVSYCDTSGQLILYASTGWADIFINFPFSTQIFNSSDSLILNGDSIRGNNWYKELVLIPMPDDSMKYYLFSAGVTSGPGFSYSIVDMNQNGGLGEVVQKNVLLQNFPCTDGITAIKHGNGRDWWIIFRRWDNINDMYYKYLITPNGISIVQIQNIGSATSNGFTNMNFSSDGTKMVVTNLAGLMELYDFDRCTGVISNPVTIHPEPTTAPYGRFWGCEFSGSGRFLYVSTYNTIESALFQYDLLSSNPVASRCTLEYNPGLRVGNGFLRRGPDQKIYFSRAWECAASPDCYPYPDSVYNYVNMNLSVINYPDSLGTACGYAPFSFYLGGKRTYYGLPNNPDYDLPAVAGSPCDTLVSINEPASISTNANLHVYYAPDWEKAFINAEKLKGKNYRLRMVDVLGKEVYSESGALNSPYFTRDLNCASFAKGMYIVDFETENEKLIKKFVIE
ncbi:MAG: T9SS type A sorting domain-containing protein [Bacteroidetes bacterium]|nr:T9SS type A sorting domain-containing protein [Bacteroidota bacterium]